MRLLLPTAALVLALAAAGSASGTSSSAIPLKIGDAVDVLNTKVACYALRSNGKDGIACALLSKAGKPVVGSYGAGLTVGGEAVVNRVNKDGSGTHVFKRTLKARQSVYRVRPGDMFGIQITDQVALGCHVLNVTSTLVAAKYRGIKVSCWRATATAPLPNTYGVSISDKIAGVFRFDAKGRVMSWGFEKIQP